MASASPSQTATINNEFGHCPRTPVSERSWRHWPSLHSKTHKSPITVSEGRSRFWGSFRVRGHCSGQSADENGSPARPERRKSIADLFNDIGPIKWHRDSTSSVQGSSTRSPSASPSKRDDKIGESPARSKRRKSISNLFSTSLRGHPINSITPERHSTFHDIPKPMDSSLMAVAEESLQNEDSVAPTQNAQPSDIAISVPPILHIRFANNDEGEELFEERPNQTIATVREIKHTESDRRVCSASTATWTSNTPTLIAKDREGEMPPDGEESDRSRTPDSYLRLLIEACESPSGVSSVSRERTPTPSPFKYRAVQPLDFLADKHTPPPNERNSSKLESLDVEVSCLSGIDPTAKKGETHKPQNHTSRRLPVSWLERKASFGRAESNLGAQVPDKNNAELTWDIGDIDLNISQRLLDRNEGNGSLEIGLSSSHQQQKNHIAQSIKLTVAKMTKNFHASQSSDEDHAIQYRQYGEQPIQIHNATPFEEYITHRSRIDTSEAWDSVNRGRQILHEAASYRSPVKSIQSPNMKPRGDSALGRAVEDSLELGETSTTDDEHIEQNVGCGFGDLENQKRSETKKINVIRPSSNEEIQLKGLKKLGDSSESKPHVHFNLIGLDNKPSDEQKGIKSVSRKASWTLGGGRTREPEPAGHGSRNEPKTWEWIRTTTNKSKTFEDLLLEQTAPPSEGDWLKESLQLRPHYGKTPPRLAQAREASKDRQVRACDSFPPAYYVDNVLDDSRALRGLGGNMSPSSPQAGQVLLSRTRSNSARRRVVSNATVQIRFPATENAAAHTETYESKSKAIAALYDYRPAEFSNFVVSDPSERILYARNLKLPPPDLAELKGKGLGVVWLPLQPNSLFEAVPSGVYKAEKPATSKLDKAQLVDKKSKREDAVSKNALLGTIPDSSSAFYTHTRDSGIHNRASVNRQLSVGLALNIDVDFEEEAAGRSLEPGWTTSDEEYVLELDPDIAHSYLGSQDSDSICSTPKLESEALLYPDIPEILLNGEEPCIIEATVELKTTKTWFQLGREFKARHPELFYRSRTSTREGSLGAYFSGEDSESSSDSESSAWLSQVPSPYCPIRDTSLQLTASSDRMQKQYAEIKSSQINTVQTGIRSTARTPSYNMEEAEHIENSGSDESTLARMLKEAECDATGTPNNTNCVADDSRDFTLGICVTCDHLQCRAENSEESSRPDLASEWSSWVEAELAQARLFQTSPSLCYRYLEDPVGRGNTYSSSTHTPESLPNQLGQTKLIGQEYQHPINSTQGSEAAQGRSSSIISLPAGFQFTLYGENMLQENHVPIKSDMKSGDSKSLSEEAPQVQAHMGISQRTAGEHDVPDTTVDHSNGSKNGDSIDPAGSQRLVPVDKSMTDVSDFLEAVNMSPTQSLDVVSPEDLNLRLVGKAARRSQFAKTSNGNALIDILKAHGLMSQTLKPALHRTQASPDIKRQPNTRSKGTSARIVTPSGNVYYPSGAICDSTTGTTNNPEALRRVPTPASVSSDLDTELESGFGEELGRIEKHQC
ncbi:hypothetical protein EG329_002748 [Mollisiaceae sp. DMI_Dod_QoI]|nr:hypothetical protein EG329_002748 [Helotiales sp. DMI_Dod_QoI]